MNNLLGGIINLFTSLTSNPLSFLTQNGFNIPQNMNDPQQMVQHMLNSGQVSQDVVNKAMQLKDTPLFKNLTR